MKNAMRDNLVKSVGTIRRAVAVGVTALVVAATLTGCASMKVSTEHDTAVNFAGYKTFAVLPISTERAGVDPGMALRLAPVAEQAVRDALTAKGMSEVAREQSDFAVLVRGQSLPRIEVTHWGYTPYGSYPGYPGYAGRRSGWAYPSYGGYPQSDVQVTEDRRLIVEVYDNKSHNPTWVGWIERSGDGEVNPDRVRDGILEILKSFPPAPKSP